MEILEFSRLPKAVSQRQCHKDQTLREGLPASLAGNLAGEAGCSDGEDEAEGAVGTGRQVSYWV